MRLRILGLCGAALLLSAVGALAQGNPTGTLSGHVVDPGGLALPGVNVTTESPQLQGKRTAVTSSNGDYILALLPPGDYTVSFALPGFAVLKQSVRVAAAQSATVDAALKLATLSEEVQVTAAGQDFRQEAQVSSSYKQDLIQTLPTSRTLRDAVILAPNVQTTGPNGGLSVSGSLSFESLFLINGVVVNENIRGQPRVLFIEDAIQETTTSTAAISAEFGRFGGGVVNAITKSGGNEFSGSFRTTFNNDKWVALTPLPNDSRVARTVPTYELTLGGPILKDRLWFFGAGRLQNDKRSDTLRFTNLPYDITTDEKRYEGKLTFSLNPRHNVRASYIKINRDELNNSFGTIMDTNSLYDRQTPEDLLSLNYTGTLSSNFFLEGQYARRRFTFIGSGSRFTDLIQGTLLLDRQRGSARYWSPTFCGVCDDETRDNQNVLVKGSYFLSTGGMGSHTVVLGFDTFDDQRSANNHQSGSDYRVYGTTAILGPTAIYPVFDNDTSTFIRWTPIFQSTVGNHFRTHSGFVNDTWRLNGRWTFNLGLRYDRNNGKDASGNAVVKDSNLSPRLSATFDPKGNGDWTVSASYGKYVSAIANSVGDAAATGGQPATIDFNYLGPQVNVGNPANPVPADQALRTLFDWFNANGGTARATRGAPSIPGVNLRIGDGLVSPNAKEFTLGVSRRLGRSGLLRVDGVWREFHDFYAQRTDLGTGQVSDARLADFNLRPSGRLFDLQMIENSNRSKRRYRGISSQLSYRIVQRVNLGANYTLSKADGNFNAESGTGGASYDTLGFYPEYRQESWNAPTGDLLVDRRHRFRLWATYEVPMASTWGSATLSLLQQFNSGTPYGAFGTGSTSGIDTRPFVTNPGYATPPANVDYYFTARDAFHTESEWRTDLALNYAHRLGLRKSELFVVGQVLNVFNRHALTNFTYGEGPAVCGTQGCIDTSVLDNANNAARYPRFNPFTEQPVRGVNWDLGPAFGTALSRYAYQTPRTFRMAVGVRF